MAITPYYQETRGTDGVLSAVNANTNVPTPSEIRSRWCFGLPLAKDDGSTMTDDDILQFLKGAITNIERKLGVFLKPTVIVCNPDEQGLVQGVDYERGEAAYDYVAREYIQYGFMQLRERQVQSLEGLKLVLPNGMVIVDFYRSNDVRKWIKLYKESGQLQIVPYAGDPTLFALLGSNQSGYPFATGQINSNLPQMLYVNYTAGYGLFQIPEDIRNAVAKQASIDVLQISANAAVQGVSSTSTGIDGLSESTSMSVSGDASIYGSLVSQYTKDVADLFDPKVGAARTTERGITFAGL
jgi:hypothetical protein